MKSPDTVTHNAQYNCSISVTFNNKISIHCFQSAIMSPDYTKVGYCSHNKTIQYSGRRNSKMVSVSVCQAGHPGSSLARSICFRKVEFYQHVIDLSPPVLTTGSTKAVHLLSCLCNNACKRSLAICRKIGHRVPLAGFCLSLYCLHVLNRHRRRQSV